jgi:hypothetical protein
VSEYRHDEERIDEQEEELNATQRQMDEEGSEDKPVDLDWEETEAAPHQGEEGQQPA